METNWAAEQLQTIRTLMEHSAIYRRALAPIMLFTGGVGLLAAAAGWLFQVQSTQGMIYYWLGVSLVTWPVALLFVRRQALKDHEPLWSPPARRVVQALLPSSLAGYMAARVVDLLALDNPPLVWWLPPIWMVLYGLGLYGAGFFMPRGIRLLGWCFFLCGLAVLVILALRSIDGALPPIIYTHCLMGAFFGGAHLAYGIYLYFTEKRGNET